MSKITFTSKTTFATKTAFTILPALFLSCFVTGCGGNPAPVEQASSGADDGQQQASSTSPGSSTRSGSQSGGAQRKQNERWTDADGREYLGNVPLDVFFDQPYTIAADTTALGGSTPAVATMPAAGTPAVASTTQQPAEPEPADAGGSGAWEDLISIEVLEAEIKETRNFFNQTLQSVGSYNSSMLMIPPKAATVAALANVALTHPGDLSWKDDAKYIRDLAKKMNESPLMRGKKDQSRLQILFENMTDTFNRSRPADLEEPPEDDAFVDVAEMGPIMARIDNAEKRLKTEVGSESAFNSKKDVVLHEASVLGTLTHITTIEGYGYADDEEFTGYAKKIVEAANKIKAAAETSDFGSYDLALSKISTTCQECHSVYRNN